MNVQTGLNFLHPRASIHHWIGYVWQECNHLLVLWRFLAEVTTIKEADEEYKHLLGWIEPVARHCCQKLDKLVMPLS